MDYKEARPLSIVYTSRYKELDKLTTSIFKDIRTSREIRQTARTKEVLKRVLINLFIIYQSGSLLYYSRNRNDYKDDSFYHKIFLTYDILIPLIDDLEKMGFIKQYKGFFDREAGIGYYTRIAITNKTYGIFSQLPANPEGISKEEPRRLVELRDKNKKPIQYKITKSVRLMEKNLIRYNAFIDNVNISLALNGETLITGDFIDQVCYSEANNSIKTIELELLPNDEHGKWLVENLENLNPFQAINRHGKPVVRNVGHTNRTNSNQRYATLSYAFLPYNPAVPNIPIIPITKRVVGGRNKHYATYNKYLTAKSIGVKFVRFHVLRNHLVRIFSNRSFGLGGRFYGSFALEIPSHLRKNIMMNGEPVVELDYSGLHIRILYHLLNQAPPEEVYQVPNFNIERHIFKAASLIMINSNSEKVAMGALRAELAAKHIPLPNLPKPLKTTIEAFKQYHNPISKYFCSGEGTRLQNIDSRIMDECLNSLIGKGIPCIPIHDSVIVPAQHVETLREVMVNAYKGGLGPDCEPVIK